MTLLILFDPHSHGASVSESDCANDFPPHMRPFNAATDSSFREPVSTSLTLVVSKTGEVCAAGELYATGGSL